MLPLIFLFAGHLAVVCLGQLPGYLLGNSILTFLGNSGDGEKKSSCEGFFKTYSRVYTYSNLSVIPQFFQILFLRCAVCLFQLTCAWEQTWRSCRRRPPGRCWPESWQRTGLQTGPGPCAKSSRTALTDGANHTVIFDKYAVSHYQSSQWMQNAKCHLEIDTTHSCNPDVKIMKKVGGGWRFGWFSALHSNEIFTTSS